jgi:hypothetical protein
MMDENQFWRLQGRINAIELILLSEVFNLAKTQPNPFQWVQDYLAAMRQTAQTLTPDVMGPEQGERLKRETRAALEEFLEQMVRHAGQLKGAPGNQ